MDIDDLWYRHNPETGKRDLPTAQCGKGKRWLARWRDPEGQQRKRRFERKKDAERHLSKVANDKASGTYIDPNAGKITFRAYAEEYLAQHQLATSTRDSMADRLRVHVYPVLGGREIRGIKPSTIRSWLAGLKGADSSKRTLYNQVSGILSAAVGDELIPRNPCASSSVRRPRPTQTRVVPWSGERVEAVTGALQERYQAAVTLGAGLGLRQGEVFGLAVDDIDWLRGWVRVRRQVKTVRHRPVFAPPKDRKERDIPLPESVKLALAEHLRHYPARRVTLPWRDHDGRSVTADLILTNTKKWAIKKGEFNKSWRQALKASGVPQGRENGMHALRHYFASVLLDAGESIKTLAEYLGHNDPGFTLRTYTHLMPSAADRMRVAVDQAFGARDQNVPADGTDAQK